jgi:hypothetical protein
VSPHPIQSFPACSFSLTAFVKHVFCLGTTWTNDFEKYASRAISVETGQDGSEKLLLFSRYVEVAGREGLYHRLMASLPEKSESNLIFISYV